MNAMEQPDPRSTATSGPRAEDIQHDIERTRAQLGRTADALAHKLDPKAQAKEKLDHARDRGAATATHARAVTQAKAHRARQAGRNFYRERPTAVLGVAAGVAVLVVAAVLWRRNS
ncbi:MAG TPA: DUF3618 domain-containing protein [Nocardioidaceae bacterium]|nr:DUF3618 domain-containing protein [Nocardioidaceae bacterium]